MSPRVLATLLLVLAPAARSVSAQAVLHEVHGTQGGQSLGFSVEAAGDFDADGFGDFIIGATDESGAGGIIGAGSATVYSGQDGLVLLHVLGTATNEHFGHAVAGVGDVNADGHDDVLVGTPFNNANGTRSGLARVYSGLDGSQLYEFKGAAANYELGWSVAGVGDLDGDGRDDFAIGETHSGQGGKVLVHSGANGSTLLTLGGHGGNDGFGVNIDGAGDVDANGTPDIIVGSGTTVAHLARVYSGTNGTLLYSFPLPYPQATWWGSAVAGAGDVNADGYADVVIGAYDDSSFYSGGGMARVQSGADGSVLYTFYGWADSQRLGYDVDGAGDVDGDGYDDIVVGVPRAGTPSTSESGGVYVYSGKDGSVIRAFTPASFLTGDELGRVVAGAGDLNGDGFDDVLAGSPLSDLGGGQSGAVVAVSFRHTVDSVTPPEVIFNKPTPITIHGKGFERGSPIAVRVGGTPATDVTWVSESEVLATTPVGGEDQLVDVEYEQNGQTVVLSDGLTLGGARIQSVFPPKGSQHGGEEVLILGKNFVDDGSIVVKFLNNPVTVLAVYEPDTIVIQTPPAATATAYQVTVESNSGSDTLLSGFAYPSNWITPHTGGIEGGTLVTMEGTLGNIQPTTLEDTQAWVGGVPAQVVSQTADTITISTPPIAEASGFWQDVLIHNSNGNMGAQGSFYYTPYASAVAAGNAFVGYSLSGAVNSSPESLDQKEITLWVIDPLQPAPESPASTGRPSGVAKGPAASPGPGSPNPTGPSAGGSVNLPSANHMAGPAGTLQGLPLILVTLKAPLSSYHASWYAGIGALNPALIGQTVSLQGLITKDGTPHGSYTNVMSFVVQ